MLHGKPRQNLVIKGVEGAKGELVHDGQQPPKLITVSGPIGLNPQAFVEGRSLLLVHGGLGQLVQYGVEELTRRLT